MHHLGRVVLEAAVSAIVKAGISAAVQRAKGASDDRTLQTGVDQNVVSEIKRDIDYNKSKLDGIVTKDLLASESFFDEGFLYLCKVFEVVSSCDDGKVTAQAEATVEGGKSKVSFSSAAAWLQMLTLAKKLKDLDESARRALCDAKERFKDARRKATKAFCNEALQTSQRILAMRYRVAATILEKIDYPEEALPACKSCLEELHSTAVVQLHYFQRQAIRADVRDLNSLICDVTQLISGGGWLLTWPCIGDEKIDPLHDRTEDHCCQTWSFGQKGEDEHKLKFAWSIASNSRGEFIVGDRVDRNIKVFDESGAFLHCLYPFADEKQSEYEQEIWNVACDQQDNIYVLVLRRNHDGQANLSEVDVFNEHGYLAQRFALTEGFRGYSLTVDEFSRVLVTGGSFTGVHNDKVEVYYSDGEFLQSFGKEILNDAQDITATFDGYSLVLDADEDSTCLRVFSAQGHQLNRFSVQGSISDTGAAVVFHRGSENVLVATLQSENRLQVSMYSKEFKFVRVIRFEQEAGPFITGVTATVKGHIAVPCKNTVLFA